MLLNRQKSLLSYISISKEIEHKTLLTKAMFLLCEEELKPRNQSLYDFFPYKYGPFSFSLVRLDLQKLINEGIISESPYQVVNQELAGKIFSDLDTAIKSSLKRIHNEYGKMSVGEIKSYVYQRYPYFAIRNEKNSKTYSQYDPANAPSLQKPQILTIGYEGKSLDAFLNTLIQNNVRLLVDIRNNPKSMKYGFSGNTLKHYIEETGVRYISIPELGVESQYRKDLDTKEDYMNLFKAYEREVLPKQVDKISFLKNLIVKEKRIALMCFEKESWMCHRSITSRYLQSYCENMYGISHL